WSGAPTGFAYQWLRCDAGGANCNPVEAATASSYQVAGADVGSTLRVQVIASNAAGPSAPARSAQSAVVAQAPAPISHLEYVVQDGTTSVYDIDHEYKLIKTISLPQTGTAEVRGVTVAPSTHLMFIAYGGDGPLNGSGTGSVRASDPVRDELIRQAN